MYLISMESLYYGDFEYEDGAGLILIQISHKVGLKLETFTVTLIKRAFLTHYLNKQRGVQTWGTFMAPSYLFFKKSKQ